MAWSGVGHNNTPQRPLCEGKAHFTVAVPIARKTLEAV